MEETLDEILLEIFQYLPSFALHNAEQVCKRWHETITTTSKLQQKIVLEVNFNNTAEALERSKSFPYKSVNLSMEDGQAPPLFPTMNREFDANIKEIFTILGNDLKILQIKNVERSLPMLFLMTPNLINLNLCNVDVNHQQLRLYPNEILDQNLSYQHNLLLLGIPRRARELNVGHEGPLFANLNPRGHPFIFEPLIMQRNINRGDLVNRHLNLAVQHHPRPEGQQPPQPIIHPRIRRMGAFRLRQERINQRRRADLLRSYTKVPIVKLNHLKFLEIKSVRKVLCWIEAPILKSFIIHDAANCDGIEELLVSTGNLEKLVMDQFVTSYFEDPENFKFQLKQLEIKSIKEAQLVDENEKFVYNLIKFLKTQKESLKDLTMNFSTVHPDVIKILNFVNNHLSLSNFSINFKLDNFIDISSTAANSVNSIMSGYLSILNNFQHIISNCENVTSLDINFDMYVDTEVLNHLAMSMPNLKRLSIHPFFTKVSSSTVFEKLESLKISKLREGPHTATWYEMAMTCPNIKELCLVDEVFEISSMKLKMVLENAKNLKILNLTGLMRFEISEEFLRIFLDDNVRIWKIEVHARMQPEEFREKMTILTENTRIQTVLHQIS
ncbi:unnamed protein product [Chironomus riparius]|uniref:F-box domain-containing protein n=1 Tax=Chironomus riparius TaxID=315576 RepID=A0A9N9WYV4_9DIPT|nr:unnamed protein product [Chironomus riparius]